MKHQEPDKGYQARLDSRGTLRIAREDIPLVVIAGLAAVFLTWIAQMPSSLWLDELGTFWVIDGDFSSMLDKAWRFQGQTPLYYGLLWGFTQIVGTSEIALRSPSLLSMAAASLLLFRFSARLFDRSTATIATALFVVYAKVGTHASDARPYALALLATLLATTLLEAWLRTGEMKFAGLYGLAGGFVFYAHYVFGTIFLAHMLYFGWVIHISKSERRRSLWLGGVFAIAVFAVAIAPTFSQLAHLLGRRDELTFTAVGSVGSLVGTFVPTVTVVFLLGVILWNVGNGIQLRRLPKDSLVLLGLGFILPPTALFVLSHVSSVSLWAARYWFVAAPYGAMLFGALITSGVRNARTLRNATLAILLGGTLIGASLKHSADDWRSALSVADSITTPVTPVLFYSGLIELSSPDYLDDPEKRSYVTSPLAYYPITGDISPLPWVSFAGGNEQLISVVSEAATGAPIVVIVNQALGSPLYSLSGWFDASGYERTTALAFGTIRVMEYAPR